MFRCAEIRMLMAKILLVDDEPRVLSLLSTLLKSDGHDATVILDGAQALPLIQSEKFDLVITDLRLKTINGIELLKSIRTSNPDLPVILLTAFATVETAIDAMKLGAFDYITKPFKVDELLNAVHGALDFGHSLKEGGGNLELPAVAEESAEDFLAESPSMKNVREMVRRVAPTDATILLAGESGVGKEVVAQAIHRNSRRKDKPFVAVNCAALPENLLESEMFGHTKGAFTGATANKEGLFETASGGTLFLDEMCSMPLVIQGKLLRVLQEKEIRRVGGTANIPVDVRVLVASTRNLEDLVRSGAFRQDLFYRLAVITIDIHPLRERKEDVLPLVHYYLRHATPEGQPLPVVSREAGDILMAYHWPGNVRELENAIQHALTFARDGQITADVLPPKIIKETQASGRVLVESNNGAAYRNLSLKAYLRQKEKEYLAQVLESVNGDKEKAAQAMKISLATLYRKLPDEINS